MFCTKFTAVVEVFKELLNTSTIDEVDWLVVSLEDRISHEDIGGVVADV